MADLFISYSRKDIAFTRVLNESLLDRGLQAWIDWQDIPPSADWLAETYKAIEAADAFIFIISKTSLLSEILKLEISHAQEYNKRLIPILINDIDLKELPESILSLNMISFRKGDDFQKSFDQLLISIETNLEFVKLHTVLLINAAEWEQHNRDKSYLLRGSRLKEAEVWFERVEEVGEPKPTKLQKEFIFSSRRETSKRKRFWQSNKKVFICYRREDTAGYAGRLYDYLKKPWRFGKKNVFMDIDAICFGAEFREEVKKSIEQTRGFIVLIGAKWAGILDEKGRRRLDNPEDTLRFEIRTALQTNGVDVIPILVDTIEMPDKSDIPSDVEALSHHSAGELHNISWNHDRKKLVRRLEQLRGRMLWKKMLVGAAASLITIVSMFVLLMTINDG